jgi:soluble lytic murein transglycosylase
MVIFNPNSNQWYTGTTFMILAILILVGCSQEPNDPQLTAIQTPLPTIPLRPFASEATPTLNSALLPTPIVTPSPSGPTMTPSATPDTGERLDIGNRAFEIGDFKLAVEQFSHALQQEPNLEQEKQADTLLKLGRSYLAEEEYLDAATIFNQLINLQGVENHPIEVFFWLGQAYAGQGSYEAAIQSYELFLNKEPDMGGYVYPLIAEAYKELGDEVAAIAAYEAALESPVFLLKEVATRLSLAEAYLTADNTESAIAQYDAIYDMASTEATRGQMTYLAGAAELSAGNVEAAHESFLQGMEEYPAAYESYLGLVELVEAEIPVDDYLRGVVDFNAAAYAPAIEALQAYLESNPTDYNPDSHLYLAWSHEALGDLESAYAELDAYAALEAEDGLLEKAKMHARASDNETALTLYQEFVADFPDSEQAPFAAWSLAALTADLGDIPAAIDNFVALADRFPEHEDAPEALYQAGLLAAEDEDKQMAIELWTRTAEVYPSTLFGSSALLAALLAESEIGQTSATPDPSATIDTIGTPVPSLTPDASASLEASVLVDLASSPANTTYQALRARDLVMGNEPFSTSTQFVLPDDETQAKEAADQWLVDQFNLQPDEVSLDLIQTLQEDARLLVGRRLWELGLQEEAKGELESLRESYAEDPLATYQLALFFRDLGLFRSSIIAASTLLNLAGTHELEAPLFIGRLAYPVYYADLILPLANQYGYDPRLQFSLVRQESLFESFARSGAAAQGLSQVIPDTGAWIAEQLNWPDYENDDLYNPYVGLNFGAYYLSQQLESFDGDVHAALAAYNAGPGNAARWHRTAGSDLDLFVDTIDFKETETYVERIYAGYDLYSAFYQAP